MPCLLAFTDACPQETINSDGPQTWHTMAAIGVILPDDPLSNGLIIPSIDGAKQLIRIPNPENLEILLQPNARTAFRSWKKIRRNRKPEALNNLLTACESGQCLFLSHSTQSNLAGQITDRFLEHFCQNLVHKSLLIGMPEYLFILPSNKREISLTRTRLISLVWIAHSYCIFFHKAREAFGEITGLFIHDNLPFDRDDDVAIIQELLKISSSGKIYFTTERNQFEFAPSDNLAAITNDFILGKNSAIQEWIWNNGRPRNFYMTADEGDGKFVRFI